VRLAVLASVGLFLSSGPLIAQKLAAAPVAGTSSVMLVTSPAQTGDTITIYTSPVAGKCGKATGTVLPLQANSNALVLAGTQTSLNLQDPFIAGEILCATVTAPDGTLRGAMTPEITVIAGPSPSKNPPLLKSGDGINIQADASFSRDVTVDALLIPASVAKRIFGGELAKHYAVVQMVISNHNQDDALILQSVLLDYSHWLFSNNFQAPIPQNSTLSLSATQAANKQYTVPSMDAREVRGQLQDTQVWSIRNTIIRGLTLAGALAASYQFVTVDPNYLKGIAAFGSTAVPAVATFWPDRTPGQIDRVNDFGFQTNHVVPKGGSETIIGFFPIDDFLLPEEKDIFIKAPAAFFTPGQMLFDSKYSTILDKKVLSLGLMPSGSKGADVNAVLVKSLVHYEAERALLADSPAVDATNDVKATYAAKLKVASDNLTDNERVILGVLQKASLSNIRVVVGGVMTVDVNAVPAVVDAINVVNDARAETWAAGAKVQGIITGSFLANATLAVTGTTTIGDIAIDPKNSSDKVLAFSFPLTAAVTPKTVLTFTLTKKANNGTTTISKPITYTVPIPPAAPAPSAGTSGMS
jgi:hypothetical protein